MNTRGQGHLPSNIETNPREVKAITLRSGKELNSTDEKATTTIPEPDVVQEDPIDKPKEDTMGKGVETKEYKVLKSSPPLAHEIPFPHRLRKKKDGEQFSKFLEIFKKLQINIPLAEALVQMPKYAKFLKEIIINKRP